MNICELTPEQGLDLEKQWKKDKKKIVYIYTFRLRNKRDLKFTERAFYSVTKYTIGNIGEHIPVEITKNTVKYFGNIRQAEKYIDTLKKKKIDWHDIASNVDLTERFIRKYLKHLTWFDISMYQKLSESFVREFKDKVKWNTYVCNPKNKFSREFIYEMEKYTRDTSLKSYFLKDWEFDE